MALILQYKCDFGYTYGNWHANALTNAVQTIQGKCPNAILNNEGIVWILYDGREYSFAHTAKTNTTITGFNEDGNRYTTVHRNYSIASPADFLIILKELARVHDSKMQKVKMLSPKQPKSDSQMKSVASIARVRVGADTMPLITQLINKQTTVAAFNSTIDQYGFTYLVYNGKDWKTTRLKPTTTEKQLIIEVNSDEFNATSLLPTDLMIAQYNLAYGAEVQAEEVRRRTHKYYTFQPNWGSTELRIAIDTVSYTVRINGRLARIEHLWHIYKLENTNPFLQKVPNEVNKTEYNGLKGYCIGFGDSLYDRNEFIMFLSFLASNGFFQHFNEAIMDAKKPKVELGI